MESWAQKTQDHYRFTHTDVTKKTHKQVADRAYNIYQKNALHNELLGRVNQIQQPRGDMSQHNSRLRGGDVGGLLLKARNANKNAQEVYFEDNAGQRGNFTDQTSFLHVTPDDKNVKNHLATNESQANNSGFSVRLSLTSDAFFDSKNSGIYADGSLKRKKAQKAEFQNLAAATLAWSTDEQQASGAKVMGPKTLNKGRPDHAVLYGSSGANIKATAQKYSNMLNHPSARSPLGMEQLAPGVSYGELLNHNSAGHAPGYSDNDAKKRHDKKSLGSFGTNRANVIASAIKSNAKANDNNRPSLNASLKTSIQAYGYDAANPARIDRNNPNVKNHIGSNQNANNRPNQMLNTGTGTMKSRKNSK